MDFFESQDAARQKTGRLVFLFVLAVVSIIVQGHGNAARAVHGLSMTRGRLPLERFAASPWIRVSIIDNAGRRAWSNPIWLDD